MDTRGKDLSVNNEDTASVRTWLQGIQIAHGESALGDAVESPSQDCDESIPCTPLRKPQLHEQYIELSPSDTTFSRDSIFDSPQQTPAQSKSARYAACKAKYAETDASSIYGEDDKTNLIDVIPHKLVLPSSPPASINSYDPPSDNEDALEAYPATLSPQVPEITSLDAPRIHHLVSCLQCVFAGLRCNRRTPACSRCKRSGESEMCLLQRRRIRSEMIDGCGTLNRIPVLLKVWGCDETVHQRKVELAEEVCAQSFLVNHLYPLLSIFCVNPFVVLCRLLTSVC
jgi:hypothetical protein